MSTPSATPREDAFRTIVSALIAVVTIFSALAGWRATVAAGDAGGADAEGLTAALNAEEARTLNNTSFYQHYAAYTDFARNKTLGDPLKKDLLSNYDGTQLPANPAAAARIKEVVRELERRRDEAYDLAGVSQYFIVTRYLDPDGSYNTRREIDETAASAARQRDLDPDTHFAEADRLRTRAAVLVGTLIVFAVAILMFTIALEGVKGRAGYVFAATGAALTAMGVLVTLLLEFGVIVFA